MEIVRSILFITSVVVIASAAGNKKCYNDFEKCIVDGVMAKVKPQVESMKDDIKALQNRKEFRCESGESGAYTFPTMPNWPSTNNVTFQTPFEEAPTVTYGIKMLDQDKTTNLRVKAVVSSVTTTGFQIEVTQWIGSKLYGAKANWMACGR